MSSQKRYRSIVTKKHRHSSHNNKITKHDNNTNSIKTMTTNVPGIATKTRGSGDTFESGVSNFYVYCSFTPCWHLKKNQTGTTN